MHDDILQFCLLSTSFFTNFVNNIILLWDPASTHALDNNIKMGLRWGKRAFLASTNYYQLRAKGKLCKAGLDSFRTKGDLSIRTFWSSAYNSRLFVAWAASFFPSVMCTYKQCPFVPNTAHIIKPSCGVVQVSNDLAVRWI